MKDLKAHSDVKQQVGQQIRDARKAKGMTQKEVGDKLGVSESAVNRYENGKVNASLDTLQKLVNVIGVSLEIKINPA